MCSSSYEHKFIIIKLNLFVDYREENYLKYCRIIAVEVFAGSAVGR